MIKTSSFVSDFRQKGAGRKALSYSRLKVFQPADDRGNSKAVGEAQRAAAKRSPARAHDHPKIDIFGRFDHLFFEHSGRLINHDQNEAIAQISFILECRL